MKKIGAVIISLTLFIGCSQDHMTSVVQDEENQIVDTLPKVELTHEEVWSLALLDTSFTVSEEEASSTVLSIIQELEKQNSGIGMKKTTFRNPQTIASIKPFKRHKESLGKSSSASPEDTSSELYLINFADEQGFAVTSADRRVANGGLLAFVPEGNLHEEDTINHPGLALFGEGLESYIEEEKERFAERVKHLEPAIEKIAETLPDSIKEKLLDSSQVSLRKSAGWRVIKNKGRGVEYNNLNVTYHYHIEKEYIRNIRHPLSPVSWGQGDKKYSVSGDPIDDELTYENTGVDCGNNRRPVSGCVATATAQIMAKYRYPEWINGRYMNWGPMSEDPLSTRITNSDSRGDISTLFEWVGKEVGMNYGCNTSGARTENAVNLLKRQGYHAGGKQGYNFWDVVSSINHGRMVLIEGFSTKKRSCFLFYCWNNYGYGHAWLIDGYMTRWYTLATGIEVWSRDWSRLLSVSRSGKANYQDYYVHMNWGWAGYYNSNGRLITHNGYFKSGVFDYRRKAVTHANNNASSNEVPESVGDKKNKDFRYKVSIWPHIYR